MKRTFMIIGILALLVIPAASQADVIHVEIAGGLSGPLGDAADAYKMSMGFSGGAYYDASPFLSFGINLGYSMVGLDDEEWLDLADAPPGITADNGGFTALMICGELRAQTGAMDFAYFFGGIGVGLYRVGIKDIDINDGGDTMPITFDSENKLGGYIHGGTAFSLSPKVKLGVKGRFNMFAGYSPDGEYMGVPLEFEEIMQFEEFSSFWEVQGFVLIGLP